MQSTDQFLATLQEWVAVFMRRSMRNFIRYTRDSGLSMSQVSALFHIHHARDCGVSELSDNLGVTRGAASQLLDRLVQQGLILRTEDPDDRRMKQLVLTEKGAHIVQEGVRARQGWLGELAHTLSPAEQIQVAAALDILIQKAYQFDNLAETAG